MVLHVRHLERSEHLAFLRELPTASFLQCPSWGDLKVAWQAESIGWVDGGEVSGAGLVLYRRPPVCNRCLAYLPEGPVLRSYDGDVNRWLDPMVAYLRSQDIFAVRIGPPLAVRYWSTKTVKEAMADPRIRGLREVPADTQDDRALDVAVQLRQTGWRQAPFNGGFGHIQPRYRIQVPLAGRTLDEVFIGLNKAWRRNIRHAKASRLEVSKGTFSDLTLMHALHRATAARQGFTPRPLEYFQRMATVMTAEDQDRFRLYLVRHEGKVLASTIMIVVRDHAWSAYGGTASCSPPPGASNLVEWEPLSDALADGAAQYDLRGISDTLDPENAHFGVTRFKIGTGGHVVEYLGEWDFPFDEAAHRSFLRYLDAPCRADRVAQ